MCVSHISISYQYEQISFLLRRKAQDSVNSNAAEFWGYERGNKRYPYKMDIKSAVIPSQEIKHMLLALAHKYRAGFILIYVYITCIMRCCTMLLEIRI